MEKSEDKSPVTDAVCFHSQQCAEKYLKAFLQENEIRFRPAHPLIPLFESCLGQDSEFEQVRDDLESLAVCRRNKCDCR